MQEIAHHHAIESENISDIEDVGLVIMSVG